ncbi:hypothetical protein SLEP1_g2340 [Rubroshorea leprosula]|uniref:Uncharacterized protein n=1 Tax=Rubroshorea leprosula TaxID=152421 RepID=A0AAV5HGT2_9ROSI|nr:hypothetical protein SLEP1_g2340 [Rubroshorea leprosula]
MVENRANILASNDAVESTKTSDPCKPPVNDLGFQEESLSLDDLLSSFPGRRTQIFEILRLLGPLNSPMFPIFIYGGASTGKTSIILQAMVILVLIAVTSHMISLTFFAKWQMSSKVLKGISGKLKLNSTECQERPNGSMVYLMPEVGLIFVSNSSPETYYSVWVTKNLSLVQSQPSFKDESNKETMRKCSTKSSGSQEGFDKTDFSAKSSYFSFPCFKEPATLDSIFDSTGGSNNRKRKRKTSSLEESPDEEEGNDEQRSGGRRGSGLMSDVLLQLSSLCNANFIIKGGSCPSEGSTTYRSTVSENLALKVIS